MRSLAKLVRHIQVFDDLPAFLQPVFDLLLDPDYEVRYFVRCVISFSIAGFVTDLENLQKIQGKPEKFRETFSNIRYSRGKKYF